MAIKISSDSQNGCRAFALVNKAAGQAIKHGEGYSRPVCIVPGYVVYKKINMHIQLRIERNWHFLGIGRSRSTSIAYFKIIPPVCQLNNEIP